MKKLVLIMVCLSAQFSFANIENNNCQLTRSKDGQKLYKCSMLGGAKDINILHVKGDIVKTAYYHGLFLSSEIDRALFKGVFDKKSRAVKSLNKKQRKQFESLNSCLLAHYKKNTSSQFIKMNKNLVRGMRDAGNTTISEKNFIEANYLVETSIYFDALEKKMTKSPAKAKAELLARCGPRFVVKGIFGILKKISKPFKELKMGCTGVAASAPMTSDGGLVLGRNFDTGLLGYFEKEHLILIHDLPNKTRVVGFASAGLHYAAGVSGFNSHGLVASLHELQTEAVTTGARTVCKRGGCRNGSKRIKTEVTPYLLHRVLMEAKTLDQAISLIKSTRGLGAWTILIADSKTNEIASIEISGKKVAVARRVRNSHMAQSNHFFSKVGKKHGYEYSLNKTLETRGRLNHVKSNLQASEGRVDYQWVIDMLSGHTDDYVGPRSFGRTTTKVYTAVTHVMVPQRNEAWMSLGESYPTTSSTFFGIRFNTDKEVPFELIGTTKAAKFEGRDNWYRSLKYYVRAYINQQSANINPSLNMSVIENLNLAIQWSLKDNIVEMPYYFMRARMRAQMSALSHFEKNDTLARQQLLSAQSDWLFLLKSLQQGRVQLHPYQESLVHLWLYRTSELLTQLGATGVSPGPHYKAATEGFKALKMDHKKHFYFNELIRTLRRPYTFNQAKNDEIHFGTVE